MYTSHSNRFGIYSTVIWLTVMLLYISNVCRNNMIVFGFLLLVLCVFFASFSLFGTRTACMYDSRSPAYVDNIFLLTMPYINEAHSICEEKGGETTKLTLNKVYGGGCRAGPLRMCILYGIHG